MVFQKLGAFVFTKKLVASIHNSEHNRKNCKNKKKNYSKTTVKTRKIKKAPKKK